MKNKYVLLSKDSRERNLNVIFNDINILVDNAFMTLEVNCDKKTYSKNKIEIEKLASLIKNQINIYYYQNWTYQDLIINIIARIISFHPLSNGNKRVALIVASWLAKFLCYEILWSKFNAKDIINVAAMNSVEEKVKKLKELINFVDGGCIPAAEDVLNYYKIIKELELN